MKTKIECYTLLILCWVVRLAVSPGTWMSSDRAEPCFRMMIPNHQTASAMALATSSQWWSFVAISYIAWRVSWANRMPIMDCDEVYNYWEPLHFLRHGTGMQTWEYASQYALRTYAYLVPMLGLSRFYELLYKLLPDATVLLVSDLLVNHPILTSKVWTFCCLRSTLAGIMALLEVLFCKALERKHPTMGLTVCLLLSTSAGMSHAAGAYLPSSTVLALFLGGLTSWWNENHVEAMVYAVVATLAVGWPFGAVLFVPMGLHVLYQHIRNKSFLRLSFVTFLWTILVQVVVMVIDHHYYGRWVSPVYNIFVYNAHGGGDELYGVEPTSYYIKNLLLNFNYIALLALPSPLLIVIRWKIVGGKTTTADNNNNNTTSRLLVSLAPLFLWMAIVVPRPHKEERFLFPIYPLLCYGTAVTLDCLWDIVTRVVNNNAKNSLIGVPKLVWFMLTCAAACLVGASRTIALSTYYAAPLSVYAELQRLASNDDTSDKERVFVCTCGEWYRFPSSYYLPSRHQLGFLPSSFQGQLPHPFTEHGSRAESIRLGGHFNDENLEESDRYVESIEACSFVVELVSSTSNDKKEECLEYMSQDTSPWNKVVEYPYLDASTSSSLHRILYIPFLHPRAMETGSVQYNSYVLYKRDMDETEAVRMQGE